ncbi:DUF1214 domain-containing protein [Microvirga sp. W0021]|uniref:DUF1214 domain-containing protein n=1 Tax=Hohaiivirga grylli TaxID=3133970 RepID=A0ABV0BJU7_9HYPH
MLIRQEVFQSSIPKRPFWLPAWPPSIEWLVLYALLLALIIGFGSALWMLRTPYPFGKEHNGPWVYWPEIGSSDIDPYAMAIVTQKARLPLGVNEGLELLATTDSTGRALYASCHYTLGNSISQARYWTITVYGTGTPAFHNVNAARANFTSSEIVRNEQGAFTINLSRDAASGNWIKLPKSGKFFIVLRLYDLPTTEDRVGLGQYRLPEITLQGCSS